MDKEEDVSDDDEPLPEDIPCPTILLTKEEKKRLRGPWKHTLIVKMFDHKTHEETETKMEFEGRKSLTD
ncbi:hypothetical protein Tco_0027622 [Tanacetum coccineum]